MRVIYVSEKCFCIIAATPFPVAFYAFFLLAIHPELKQCVASALKGFFRPVLSVPCMVPHTKNKLPSEPCLMPYTEKK